MPYKPHYSTSLELHKTATGQDRPRIVSDPYRSGAVGSDRILITKPFTEARDSRHSFNSIVDGRFPTKRLQEASHDFECHRNSTYGI